MKVKGAKKNLKPSFAGKIKKKDPILRDPLLLDQPEIIPDVRKSPNKMAPFKPNKVKVRSGYEPINISMSDQNDKPKKAQGPSKLLEIQKRAKDRLYDDPVPSLDEKEDSYDDSFEGYEEDNFESDDDKKDIKKALIKENRKAIRFSEKFKPKIKENKSFLTSNGFNHNGERTSSRGSSNPRLRTPDKGFAEGRKLVMNKKNITKGAANKQHERIENLRPIIQIEFEEYDNQLNLKSQTAQDLYFNKLQTFKIQNEMIQTNDDNIERDIQTDPIDEKIVQAQVPEDLFEKSTTTKAMIKQDLNGFIQRVTPVIEMIWEENIQLADLLNPSAKSKSPVEQKAKISFPNDLLKVLRSKIVYVSCTHSFETAPHMKWAISYVLESEEGEKNYITIVYHLSSSSAIKYLKTSNEVTWICTPFENVVICGTKLGSILVFDLDENFMKEDIELRDEVNKDLEMEALRQHYKILEPTFTTDGLPEVVHFFEITKLVSLVKQGSYRVVAIDNVGKLSSWILIEFSEGNWAGSLADLTMKVGGKMKLALHSEIDLSDKLKIMYDPETFEIDFDPNDHNSFIFSTSDGMYYSKLYNQVDDNVTKSGGPIVRTLDTTSVGELIRVTSISYSDQGFILTGFEDGSIGIYHIDFSSPISIWYNSWETAVKTIKWWTIYFSEGRSSQNFHSENSKNDVSDSRFTSRLWEFFVIDINENFYIWNLNKNIHKSIHKINFAEKHGGIIANSESLISNTWSDQSFYTGFCVKENQVVFYFMNFKKGTKISKDKIVTENQKSIKLLKIQPN